MKENNSNLGIYRTLSERRILQLHFERKNEKINEVPISCKKKSGFINRLENSPQT